MRIICGQQKRLCSPPLVREPIVCVCELRYVEEGRQHIAMRVMLAAIHQESKLLSNLHAILILYIALL